MARSRLNNQLKEKSIHTLIFSVGGSLVIILLLIFFGVPALLKLGMALTHTDKDTTTTNQAAAFIAPPSLDRLYSATNSASLKVTGTTTDKYTIRLYNNDTFIDEVTSKDDGTFIFRKVTLKEGDNALKAIAKDPKHKIQSKESEITHVFFSNKEPSLTIDYPTDGSAFKDNRSITIRGKTDTSAQVSVNGFLAIMSSNGGFSYNLSLHDGGNDITVVTKDHAGNTKQQTIHITYN